MNKIHQGAIIIVAGALLIFFAVFQFMFVPMRKEIKVLKRSVKDNRNRNKRIQDLASQAAFFGALNKKVHDKHEMIKAQLPKEIKVSGLLRELSFLAEKNNVSIVSIRPIESTTPRLLDGNYSVTDIRIILECSYENLGRYFEAIEKTMLTVMAIKSVRLSSEDENSDATKLQGEVTIEAYYQGAK